VEILRARDDFWMLDYPINPINIITALYCSKIDRDPEEYFEFILKKVRKGHHIDVKFIKILGKYFLQPFTDNEYATWKKTHTGIIKDIKTHSQLIEFMTKKKALYGHLDTMASPYLYYIPEINGNESAIVLLGHHSICDGLSGFQAYHMMSDDPEYKNSEYPFFRVPKIPFAYWMYLYITFLY